MNRPLINRGTIFQAYSFCTQTSYRCHVMTDKQDCPSLSFRHILHLANSLLLEFRISHCQHLVHHQNFRLQMGGDSKSQPHGHTRRITFHWSIDIFLHTGESHNLIQLAGNLRLGHPHDGTIHINILPSCHFGMKACTHFQQRGNTPPCTDTTGSRRSHPRKDFQQSGLSRTVLTYNTQHFTFLHMEINIFQRPYKISRRFLGTVILFPDSEIRVLLSTDPRPPTIQITAQRAGSDASQCILLADILKLYRYFSHSVPSFKSHP